MTELVRSLTRGIAALQSFDASTPRQTLSQVARNIGLSRATARRMLVTLAELGFVSEADGVYELTPKVLELGFSYLSSLTLTEVATPHLEALSADVGESSSVSVLDDTEIVYVARVPVRRIMTASIGLGSRFPAFQTSMGRVLLADLEDREVGRIYKESDRSLVTEYTVRSEQELKAHLAEIRESGWALVDQEVVIGVRSIAAPLRNGSGKTVAAMNISTQPHTTSMDELHRVLLPKLLATAAKISASLVAHDARDLIP